MNFSKIAMIIIVMVFATGCAGKQVNIEPSNPVYKPKSEFELNYGFFITSDEREVGYTLEVYPELSEPIQSFNKIDTLDEFIRFENHFWNIRDTDPNTPENEFKELIDRRISDIENEIFATDFDILGTRFETNGGLKGDMAHVYLLWGVPGFKAKFSGTYLELMTWYYFDPNQGQPLFRFLFYKKYDRMVLFKSYGFLDLASVLKEISYRSFLSNEDLNKALEELTRNEEAVHINRGGLKHAFQAALFEFSYYSDIVIEGGNNKDKFGALDPPEPVSLTVERLKPTILGQPNIPEGTELFESSYRSFLPADLQIIANPIDDRSSFSISVAYADLDWEIKDQMAEAILNARISFQNTETRTLNEFETQVVFRGPRQAVESLIRGKNPKTGKPYARTVNLDETLNWLAVGKEQVTLRQLIDDKLQSGEYVVNIYLQHTLTKKYNAWREEVMIK